MHRRRTRDSGHCSKMTSDASASFLPATPAVVARLQSQTFFRILVPQHENVSDLTVSLRPEKHPGVRQPHATAWSSTRTSCVVIRGTFSHSPRETVRKSFAGFVSPGNRKDAADQGKARGGVVTRVGFRLKRMTGVAGKR